jgi:hypothetical protein
MDNESRTENGELRMENELRSEEGEAPGDPFTPGFSLSIVRRFFSILFAFSIFHFQFSIIN